MGVIRWLQVERVQQDERVAVASASGRFPRRRRAHVGPSRPFLIGTHVRWLPGSALDSKCNFSSAVSSHREGGGLSSKSKLLGSDRERERGSGLADPGRGDAAA